MLCGALAGCGGDKAASSGAYTGENLQIRTAGMAASQNNTLSARVARLENDVAAVKNDMSQLAMTYNGLMTTNDRIDSLLTKIERKQEIAPTPSVEKADLMPPVAAPVKVAERPADVLPKEATVMGVRLGEHPDKTRLVIDWSKLGDIKTEIDNTEKLLLITLSKTAWDAKKNVSGLSSPLISGWTVEDSDGMKTLAIQLKKPVKILSTEKLKAQSATPGRVVIDLSAT